MIELEMFSDQQLKDRIGDCNYLLQYGCTQDMAATLFYELNVCAEILRRRNYDPQQGEAPKWFNELID